MVSNWFKETLTGIGGEYDVDTVTMFNFSSEKAPRGCRRRGGPMVSPGVTYESVSGIQASDRSVETYYGFLTELCAPGVGGV
jgi:hypothetical protein